MSENLIEATGVSKKFCRSLKRSLLYGVKDLGREIMGLRHGGNGSLRLDEFWAIKEVSFDLKRGECLSLIGRNGAGKTTLLRMLNGLIKPDGGKIVVRGRMQALIALGAGFNPILTGRENVYVNGSVLGLSKAEIDRHFDEIVDFSGIGEFIDSPVQSYSSGMAVRLGFAVGAHLNPDVLLVDEVLAVGDEGFQVKCLNKVGELRANGTAIILVTHNMPSVLAFSSRVLLLRPGGYDLFDNVHSGVLAYKNLFENNALSDTQAFCSEGDGVRFHDVQFTSGPLQVGDDFTITLPYQSEYEYKNVEVDCTIRIASEISAHFQATNKAYDANVDVHKGHGTLCLKVKNLRVIGAKARIGVSIWREGRQSLLFWWAFFVEFQPKEHSTGSTFYDMEYLSVD